jgi:hypothetical protein
MGVHGLWGLLAPVGRRVSVETLTGKRLADTLSNDLNHELFIIWNHINKIVTGCGFIKLTVVVV